MALSRFPTTVKFTILFSQAEDGIRDATVTGVQTCLFRSSTSVVWVPLNQSAQTVVSTTIIRAPGARHPRHLPTAAFPSVYATPGTQSFEPPTPAGRDPPPVASSSRRSAAWPEIGRAS